MNQLTPIELSRVAAYVDEAMTAEERAQFESELAVNAALREELEIQASLDASLNRLFEYSAAEAGAEAVAAPRALASPFVGRSRVRRWSALAAAVVVVGVTAWVMTRRDPNLIPPQQVWANMEKANFVPNWRCEDEPTFRAYLNSRLGESFAIDESDSLKVVGWGYSSDYQFYPISEQTLTLINRVGDQHAVVLIDRAENDRALKVPEGSGLHLYRKRVGDLVLYEMSPMSEARVLPRVRS
ncbi:MAG TPA: hypothetical protein VD997_08450 [Phycisphaerales bacterium]|nr:hypothetical protein [Phycisphaerales bacterium]